MIQAQRGLDKGKKCAIVVYDNIRGKSVMLANFMLEGGDFMVEPAREALNVKATETIL